MADNYISRSQSVSERQALTNVFLRGVYLWMSVGLAVTAVVAWYVSQSPAILNAVFGNSMLLIGLVVAQLGLVIALSAAVHKMSAATATGLFLGYSALTGLTLSTIFIVYTYASIVTVFITCSGMFAAMSLYGLITKRDLTSMGSFMFMGLIGLLIASIVNFFLQSPALYYAISGIGVIVFAGFTAYDTQAIRNMGENAPMDDALAIRRGTVIGALRLYLDFINLFIMLLRLFGDRR